MDLKIIRNKLVGNDQERAVSPVIGVILMVAITVILAAVIAAFVMDMGPSESTTPSSQIALEGNSGWSLSDGEVDSEIVTLAHDGGEPINLEEIEINVALSGSVGPDANGDANLNPDDIEADTTLDANNGFSDDGVTLTNAGSSDEFTVGDSFSFDHSYVATATDGSEDGTFEDGTLEITIVHTPSNGIIAEEKVDLAEWSRNEA